MTSTLSHLGNTRNSSDESAIAFGIIFAYVHSLSLALFYKHVPHATSSRVVRASSVAPRPIATFASLSFAYSIRCTAPVNYARSVADT